MKKFLMLTIAFTTFSSVAMAQNWNYATQAQPYQGRYQQPVQRQYQQPQRQNANQQKAYSTQQQALQVSQTTDASAYKLGNPLYVPQQGQNIINGGFGFYMMPEDKDLEQEKATAYEINAGYTYGITDKLSFTLEAGYSFSETDKSKVETTTYGATAGIRYLLSSMNGFDFNVGTDLNISKYKQEAKYGVLSFEESARLSSLDFYMLMGKKVQNVTPYVKAGFETSLWSEFNAGTSYFIQPGLYVDINSMLGFDFNLDIAENSDTDYNARLDFYPSENISLGLGFSFAAPSDSFEYYGVFTQAKFAF